MDSLYQTPPRTLPETNISIEKAIMKMVFLFQRWDMLVPWRVVLNCRELLPQKKLAASQSSLFRRARPARPPTGRRQAPWGPCLEWENVGTYIWY